MNEGASLFLGRHDFTRFTTPGALLEANPVREIMRSEIIENKDFIESLNSFCTKFDKHLEKWSKTPTFPQKLKNSISYINKTGGKRIRPFIVCEIASLFGAGFDKSIAAAVAIEMIHTYSLIHDDLPSMDNDDFRRGKMTLHKKYDEAIAILTGDSLLTESFSLLAKNSEHRKEIVSRLAKNGIETRIFSAGNIGLHPFW